MKKTDRDLSEAYRCAHDALRMMAEHGVLPTPHNYLIWYDYAAGWNADLRRDIDQIIAEGRTFTADLIDKLYQAHFSLAAEEQAVLSLSNNLHATIGTVTEEVSAAMRSHSGSSTKLEDFSNDLIGLGAAGGSRGVRLIVQRIQAETGFIVNENRKLSEKLTQATSDLHELRDQLDRVRRDASTDTLTGLANRRMFDGELRRATLESLESGKSLALALSDVDHFKHFNDSFGHRVGDEVLRVIAKVLVQQTKGRDTAARYGGEEFALILPDTGLDGACVVADQVRRSLAGKQLVNRSTGASYGAVTMSWGIAVYREGETLEEFVQRADDALYRAKRSGRDRWEAERPRGKGATVTDEVEASTSAQ